MAKYELLYRGYGLLDARSIQLLLESFQIPSKVIQESAGVAMGLNVGKLGSANVYVLEPHLAEAEKILAMLDAGELELPESNEILLDESVDPEDIIPEDDEED